MQLSDKVSLESHGVTTVFVGINDQYPKLELLEPFPLENTSSSPIHAFLLKNPRGGIHHLCFDVENLDYLIEELKEQHGMTPLAPKKVGAHGKDVVFYHPKDCFSILMEFQQI